MENECEVYLDAFTGTTIDFSGIILSLLLAADGLVFLTVLQGNQVCIVHSVGRFSCRLGRPTAACSCICGLLEEKLGGSLPQIVLVTAAGLVQCIQLETQINLTKVNLEGLAADPEDLIAAPLQMGSVGVRPLVEVQKMVMVPKAWAPYFMEPHSPWEAIDVFKIIMVNIPSYIKNSFEFIET